MQVGRQDILRVLRTRLIFSDASTGDDKSYATCVWNVTLSTGCHVVNVVFLTDNAYNNCAALGRKQPVLFDGQSVQDMQRWVLHLREDKHVTCKVWWTSFTSEVAQDNQRVSLRDGRPEDYEQDFCCLLFVDVGREHLYVGVIRGVFQLAGCILCATRCLISMLRVPKSRTSGVFSKRVIAGGACVHFPILQTTQMKESCSV